MIDQENSEEGRKNKRNRATGAAVTIFINNKTIWSSYRISRAICFLFIIIAAQGTKDDSTTIVLLLTRNSTPLQQFLQMELFTRILC